MLLSKPNPVFSQQQQRVAFKLRLPFLNTECDTYVCCYLTYNLPPYSLEVVLVLRLCQATQVARKSLFARHCLSFSPHFHQCGLKCRLLRDPAPQGWSLKVCSSLGAVAAELQGKPGPSGAAAVVLSNFAQKISVPNFMQLEITTTNIGIKKFDLWILSLPRRGFSPIGYIPHGSQKEMIFHRQN